MCKRSLLVLTFFNW